MDLQKAFDTNRETWNKKVAIHAASDFYDMEAFKAGKTSLNSYELNALGDVFVIVPARHAHRDARYARFDQAAGQQHALADSVAAVCVTQLAVFPVYVKGLTCFAAGDEIEGTLRKLIERGG